ncbi:MAG: hypothetical protein IKM35_02765 [Bacteroidaceae bacterium]|nr:hypothetical protein [Bacteroidaceae bacterium]
MKQKENILDNIGGKSGFKVPDGYFEQLSTRIIDQLPERELPQPEVITTWHKLRPYIYMAAMFAGIWLMVQVFVAPAVNSQNEMIAETEHEEDLEEYMLYSMDEYTIFETLYAESE